MENKDIATRLIEMYIKGIITKKELDQQLNKLEKRILKEPPTIY